MTCPARQFGYSEIMTTDTLSTGVDTASCPTCNEPVIKSGPLLLTPTKVVGGLYRVARGYRVRRPLRDMTDEFLAHGMTRGGGHDIHECSRPERWSDR